MQVDSNNGINALHGVTPTFSPAPRPAKTEAIVDFKDAEVLTVALQRQKEVREAKVEKALNLIGQVQWPPAETIRRISTLLAAKSNPLSS